MTKEISWQAPEFIHYPKSFWWSAGLSLVSLILVGYFLWQKEILTALLFALFFILLFYFSRVRPKQIHVRLTPHGLKLNHYRLPFQQITSFWIVYEPPEVKTLNFETTAYLNRFLTLQLENENPLEIREFLLQFLPEDLDRAEQFADKVSRKLKF